MTVPLCFYGTSEDKEVRAPESVAVTLSGKREDLIALDLNNIALHINMEELRMGDNLIEVSTEKLFLPSTVKVVHWSPLNPVVTLTENEITT